MRERSNALVCSLGICEQCRYVGHEIRLGGQCPVCHGCFKEACTPWPQMNWVNAAEDIEFVYKNKRLELLTISVAAYFEGLLHTFLKDGMWFVYEPTRIAGKCAFPEENDQLERFKAENEEFRRRYEQQEKLFSRYRYRSWFGRLNKLCTKIYGTCFDDLVARHCENSRIFMENRDNIHQWRNILLHRGISLQHIWPKEVRESALNTAIEFVRQCWVIFRPLYNEQIHKPWWHEKVSR